jgi:hypothetical protein
VFSRNLLSPVLADLKVGATLTYQRPLVPVRWTQETYCDGADKWERCLRGEEAAGFDFGEAFFQGEKLVNFPPLSGVTEISQVETLVAGVLKAGELRLKEG